MTLKTGDKAPDFTLDSDGGKSLSLADFAGKWLIVYFYPKDNTPGCTREAVDFTAATARLQKHGALIVGISKDSVKTHCGFRDKFGLRFPLLSDPDLEAMKAYGAWGIKTMYGKKVEGTIRSTFLISPEGVVTRVWSSVKVDGHVAAVEHALAEAQDGSGDATAKKTAVKKTATKTTATKTTATKTTAPKKKTAAKKSSARS